MANPATAGDTDVLTIRATRRGDGQRLCSAPLACETVDTAMDGAVVSK
jgi:hypothetical protein